MAITSITQDRHYAFAGDTVQIQAVINAGTRFRARLVAAPPDSKLALYDPAKENYLVANRVAPDVPGRYTIEVVEEMCSVSVPHFSNDFGGDSLKGVERVEQIGIPAKYTLTVGQRVRRAIGLPPDQVYLDGWAHSRRAVVGGVMEEVGGYNVTDGLLTCWVDAARCPRISIDAVSDAARLAAGASTVAQAVQDIGGYGDASHRYGTGYGEDQPLISWDTVISPTPIQDFGLTVQRLNQHIDRFIGIGVHISVDDSNTLVAPVSGLPAHQIAFLNAALSALSGHAEAGTWHHSLDSVLSDVLSEVTPLGTDASEPERVNRTNYLATLLSQHMTRIRVSGSAADWVHLDMADNAPTIPKAVDSTSASTAQGWIWSIYEAHRVRVAVTAGNYHAVAYTAGDKYDDALPVDRDSYVTAVGTAWACFRDHVSNRAHATGESSGYHNSVDTALATLMAGSPTDYASAVLYHETLNWALATHAKKGFPVHGIAWAGGCAPIVTGIEAVNHAFRTALLSAAGTAPDNENYAASKLIMLGGWQKS